MKTVNSNHRLVLFNPYQSNLGVIAMKGYSALPKPPALLEPHHQTVECHIQGTRSGVSYPSAEVESVYSTAPADWARNLLKISTLNINKHISRYKRIYTKIRISLSDYGWGIIKTFVNYVGKSA